MGDAGVRRDIGITSLLGPERLDSGGKVHLQFREGRSDERGTSASQLSQGAVKGYSRHPCAIEEREQSYRSPGARVRRGGAAASMWWRKGEPVPRSDRRVGGDQISTIKAKAWLFLRALQEKEPRGLPKANGRFEVARVSAGGELAACSGGGKGASSRSQEVEQRWHRVLQRVHSSSRSRALVRARRSKLT